MVVRKLFTASLQQVNIVSLISSICIVKVHTSLVFFAVFSVGVVAICTVVAVLLFRKFFYGMITNETGIFLGDYDTNAYARADVVLNIFGVKVNILYLFNGFHWCVPLVFIGRMNFIITKIGLIHAQNSRVFQSLDWFR